MAKEVITTFCTVSEPELYTPTLIHSHAMGALDAAKIMANGMTAITDLWLQSQEPSFFILAYLAYIHNRKA